MTHTAATPVPSPTSQPAPGLKACRKCGEAKLVVAFTARRTVCRQCDEAARARRQERKEAIRYTPALCERICDLVAMGSTIAEIAEMPGMPTARQMAAWLRQHEEFRDAYEVARQARADARSDRVDEALNDLRAGKISAMDCRVIVETELKLASKESPARYGERIEVTAPDALKAGITAAMAIEALIAALPDLVNSRAPEAPKPLLPSPIPSAGDSAVGAAGDCVAPAASSPVEPTSVEADADPYAEPGEDLGPGFELTARAAA